jgi:ankyrin repeat protein
MLASMARWRLTIVLLLAAPALAFGAADERIAGAAERRDARGVERLVGAGAAVNGRQPDGATALHWAAHWDDVDLVRFLLRSGADVGAANDHGVTPLMLACENGNQAIVDILLGAGASPNAALRSGETVLMTAARTGNLAAVRALIARGAQVNAAESSHGQTALMWAIAERHPQVAAVLVKAGADVSARSRVRRRTVQTGNRYGDQRSITNVSETDVGGFTPLLFAARAGDVESGRYLLDAGAPIEDAAPNGATPLVVAAHSGHGSFGIFLLERGANPKTAEAGYSALHAAVLRGESDLVKALLARGADPNLPLAKATPSRYYSKDYAFADALLGATPLWLAARYGEPDIMRALVAAGADPRFAMPDGTTTLMVAVSAARGFGTFRAGDRRDRYLGPADVAAKAEGEDDRITLEAARAAVELGADVDAANAEGDTALHVAASLAVNNVVEYLAARGATLEKKNKRGQTPLAIADAPVLRVAFPIPAELRKMTADLLRKLGAKE